MLSLSPISLLSLLISKMPPSWPFETALNKMLWGKWVAFIMSLRFPWIVWYQALRDLTPSASLAVCCAAFPMTPDASDRSDLPLPLHFCECSSFHSHSQSIPNPFLCLSHFYSSFDQVIHFGFLNVFLPTPFWSGWCIKKTAGDR